MNWEKVEHGHGNQIARAAIYGGWLVLSQDNVNSVLPSKYGNGIKNDQGWEWRTSICFVPDPEHKWDLKANYFIPS